MDRVRFGRALGYGARHAAKALTQAAAAASAPNPSPAPGRTTPAAKAASTGGAAVRETPLRPAVERATDSLDKLRTTSRQARQASGSLLQPVKRFSSVLWLQVSGSFFALMALSIAMGAWRMRETLHKMAGNSHHAIKLYLVVAIFLVFTYFAVSSFVRAARR